MTRKILKTDRAPAPVGPYSQAVEAHGFLFLSGQIPLDPANDQLINGNITEATDRICRNLQGVLEARGLTFQDVVKTTVFLTDMGEFGGMNEVYAKYFGSPGPARSTVQVAALPKGVRVEIELVAVVK